MCTQPFIFFHPIHIPQPTLSAREALAAFDKLLPADHRLYSHINELHQTIDTALKSTQPALICILTEKDATQDYTAFWEGYSIQPSRFENGLAYARMDGRIHVFFLPVESTSIQYLHHLLSPYLYALLDKPLYALSAAIGDKLRRRNQTIATAESCTGGLLIKTLTDIPGASAYALGGVCAYTAKVKENILKVPAETIDHYGIVSAETAAAMAHGALQLYESDIAIATTGVAGPGADNDGNPEGLVWTAIAVGGTCESHKYTAYKLSPILDRNFIRRHCSEFILKQLLQAL